MNQDVPCPPLGFEKTQLLFSLVTAAGCFGEGSRLAASSPSTSASLGDSPLPGNYNHFPCGPSSYVLGKMAHNKDYRYVYSTLCLVYFHKNQNCYNFFKFLEIRFKLNLELCLLFRIQCKFDLIFVIIHFSPNY